MRYHVPGDSKKRHYRLLVTGIALLLSTGGLHAPKIETIRYYTVTPKITVEATTASPLTLGIRPIFSARVYGTAIAYLDHDLQIGYHPKDEWAEQPAAVVTRAISDALAASGRFADVGNAADMARPNLLLTGELRIYHENRTVEPPTAELEVRLELRQATEPGSLWAETIRETEPLRESTPAALAEAMGIVVTRFAERVATSIAAAPLPEPQKSQH